MKRISICVLTFFSLLFLGCVDENFDISDVDNSNVGVGDSNSVVTAPIATVEIVLDEILDDSTRAVESYVFISQDVDDSVSLGENWLNEDIKSVLTNGNGELVISAEFSPYPEGLPDAIVSLSFDNLELFDVEQTISTESTKITSKSLSDDDIDAMAATSSLSYAIYFSEKTFSCDFDGVDCITMKLTLTRTGAIIL